MHENLERDIHIVGGSSGQSAERTASEHESPLASTTLVGTTGQAGTVQERPKSRRRGLDFKAIREMVSMADVLRLLDYQPTARRAGQLRGPCPVHGSTSRRSRSFSVDLVGNRFQCFAPRCGAKGNQLDLWVAVTGIPLYEAAWDLCEKMGIEPPRAS